MLEALWVRSRKAPSLTAVTAWLCWDEAMPLPAPGVSVGGSEVVQPALPVALEIQRGDCVSAWGS